MADRARLGVVLPFRFFPFQPQRRRVGFQQLLFGTLLGLLQKLHCLRAGTEQLKVHRFIIRRGPHPLSPVG